MTAPIAAAKNRIESIDLLRGLVMLIMAIDHVRDFMHLGSPDPTDLSTTTPILFFTRWITHFCAPTFVFLSGMSACLAGMRRTKSELSIFLIKRGLWLLFIEVAVINLAMTLNPLYNLQILQVIWAIGGSMILLGLLLSCKASRAVIGTIGVLIFFGHNILDIVKPAIITQTFVGQLLLSGAGFGNFISLGHNHYIIIAYALLPWTGVMLLGYVFGSLYKTGADAAKRKKILLSTGLALLALFLILRFFNIYGDPSPWAVQKNTVLSILSFFNVTKYPCSLLYLCMTLGTALVLLASIEGLKGKLASVVIVYGNVPFFYYVCHWYLVQAIHIILFFAMGFGTAQIVTPGSPFLFAPHGFGVNLFGIYIIWLVVIFILYWPCRWFSRYKKSHQQWWLSYL
jgi:uncharacterized membrane protein